LLGRCDSEEVFFFAVRLALNREHGLVRRRQAFESFFPKLDALLAPTATSAASYPNDRACGELRRTNRL
jgi:hypothetical protein